MDILLSKIADCIKNKNFLAAEEIGWTLYKQNKENFTTIKILALVLLLQGKNHGSLDLYSKAFNKNPDDNDVVTNLAHLYLKVEEFQKSFDMAKKSIQQDPNNHAPYLTMSELYVRKREFGTAYNYIQELLKRIDYNHLKDNSSICFFALDVFFAANKNDEVLKFVNYCYEKDFNPDIFYYHVGYDAKSIKKEIIDKAKEFMIKNSYDNLVEKGKALTPILFGLANYYEKNKDEKLSEDYFIQGNELITEIQRYQPLKHQVSIKKIKKLFINKLLPDLNSSPDGRLIFILGMPRSGTTLVESIISSAKNTISGGELRSMNELFIARYEDGEDQLTVSDPGGVYLDRIKFIRSEGEYFIDKLPGNYHNIGFIKKIFPNAKIIHVKRDPWDNAISLYKQFYVSNIPFASSFFNIGVAYANYEEIMRFWKEDMKMDYFTVQYEDLVKDPDTIGNKIFEYCEIPQKYDPSERGRFFARTASKNQVTKDIYTKSVKKSSFDSQKIEFLNSLKNQRKYWEN